MFTLIYIVMKFIVCQTGFITITIQLYFRSFYSINIRCTYIFNLFYYFSHFLCHLSCSHIRVNCYTKDITIKEYEQKDWIYNTFSCSIYLYTIIWNTHTCHNWWQSSAIFIWLYITDLWNPNSTFLCIVYKRYVTQGILIRNYRH